MTIHMTNFYNNVCESDRVNFDNILAYSSVGYRMPTGTYYNYTHVGVEGLFNTFKFLFRTDPEFADLAEEDHLFLPPSVYRTIVDELVYRLRGPARAEYGIGWSLLFFMHLFISRKLDKFKDPQIPLLYELA